MTKDLDKPIIENESVIYVPEEVRADNRNLIKKLESDIGLSQGRIQPSKIQAVFMPYICGCAIDDKLKALLFLSDVRLIGVEGSCTYNYFKAGLVNGEGFFLYSKYIPAINLMNHPEISNRTTLRDIINYRIEEEFKPIEESIRIQSSELMPKLIECARENYFPQRMKEWEEIFKD